MGHPSPPSKHDTQPFIQHVYELRRRLFYVSLSVVLFAAVGYFIQKQLVQFLLLPARGQQFIYTSPGGGLNFIFQICIYFGIALSTPVIIYQILKYIEPLIHTGTKRIVIRYSFFSAVLALFGGAFGYYLGLPVALRFLAHQFTTSQIQPLLTIQEYMSFLVIYLVGAAMLFQIPLVITFINRIKPLKPRKLLAAERYVVAVAFIAAAIMTPTTDVFNQLIFAGPIIAMYQLSVGLVYFQNRKRSRQALPVPIAVPQKLEEVPVAEVLDNRTGSTAYSFGSFNSISEPYPKARPAYRPMAPVHSNANGPLILDVFAPPSSEAL